MIKPLDVARELYALGFVVLPSKFRDKAPSVAWKEYQTRRPTEDEIATWFSVPICNFWILCGKPSGLVVLDCDSQGALTWATEHIGQDVLDATPMVRTTKGWHFYFRLAEDDELAQWSHHADGVDIDVRSDGGGVICPPSVHKSGAGYAWKRSPFDCELQAVPDALRRPLSAPQAEMAPVAAKSTLASLLASPAAEGGRNEWLARVAGHYAKQLPHQDAYEQSVRLAAKTLRPPLPEAEIGKLIASIWGAETAGGNGNGSRAAMPADHTESAVAHAFAAQCGEALWYVPERGWLVYDEHTGRYVADNDAALALVQGHVERMRQDAATAGDKDAIKFARTCSSARGLKAIRELAQIEPRLRRAPGEFDADKHLLNCRNGVLDLETGELHPHSPRYLMTRLAGCAYDPSIKPTRWLAHLDYILAGDTLEVLFLWRWFGRALSGMEPSDNCRILMPIGVGANGKTITVETAAAVLGDYAVPTDFPTWCVNYGGGGGPREDLAKLGGARLVITAESGRNHTIDENLIKQYTGGEYVSPRVPYARAATVYRPEFSMLMSTNHEPRMDDHSDGFWRRFLKIVFGVSIPEPDQDQRLLSKLMDELPGILAWMVEGYQDWRRHGLEPPASVLLATAESRRNNDVVGQFIEECIEAADGEMTELREVYWRYKTWCEECGIRRAMTLQQLSTRLIEHQIERSHDGKTRRALLRNVRIAPSTCGGVSSWIV